tara:strand:+ start:178 stop:381 length:204 start_codon:yes stop_codon:yes gene_type:complete
MGITSFKSDSEKLPLKNKSFKICSEKMKKNKDKISELKKISTNQKNASLEKRFPSEFIKEKSGKKVL